MKLKHIFLLAVVVIFGVVPRMVLGEAKPVLAHYMPWFQSPYSLGSGNWGYHWKLGNNFNPNIINSTNDERQIASWYYPQIGPYDSLDPAVLEYHVLLMKLSGIDGVIVDWYGQDNYYDYGINNQRTLALFNYTRKAGLKFALCYEDATIPAEISGGNMNGVNVNAANAIAHAQQTLLYAQTNFFNDPSFLRLSNAPVFLNFGPQYFKNSSDWTAIFSVLAASNRPAFFTEDNRLAAGQGAFAWPPMALSGGGVLSSEQLQTYLASFEQTAKNQAWPNFISSAFPRFHDFYAQAGAGSSYGQLDDANGNTLTSTLTRALTNASALVQLVTWNDYGEGTIIEPTLPGNEATTRYGYTDLGIVQNLRRQYLEAKFPYHTNDLALALRLYNLRTHYAGNQPVAAELDRVFTNIIAGNLTTANLQLTGIESNRPVIYGLSTAGNQLQFVIGGYLASGAQVEMSTDLLNWQPAHAFTAGTNQVVFSTDMTQPVCRFFKVQ